MTFSWMSSFISSIEGASCSLPVYFLRKGRTRSVLAVLLLGALGLERLGVLGGDDNGVDHGGLDRAVGVLVVLDGDLGLAVGAQPPQGAVLAHVRQHLAELGRHQVVSGMQLSVSSEA